jgi:hypothetical protein
MGAHDTLSKDILEVLLDELGIFVREREVPAPASQRADSYFAPHANALPALQALGLLGRMCLRPCVLDPFSDAPSPEEVRESLPVSLVVLPEVEDTPDTVALRLMSRSESLNRALRTLRGRTDDVPQGRRLFVAAVKWIHTWRGRGLRWEEDAMLDLTETEAFLARQFAAGMQQGLAPLLRQFSRRLDRALTDDERAVVTARLNTLGADRLGDVVLALSALDLSAWLADPAAR